MAFPEHSRGITATILFHGLLLLYLLTAGFRTQLPLPGERGIPIDFGTTEEGAGLTEPAVQAAGTPAPPAAPEREQAEEMLAQDTEEAPALQPEPEKVKVEQPVRKEPEKPKPTPAAQPVKTETPPEKPAEQATPQPEPPKVNQRALFTGNNVTSPAEGQGETASAGNQGAPEGSTGSPRGSGGGGNSFDLAGRSLSGALPRPDYVGQNEGTVVIEITVDKDGRVIQAQYRLRGSTTSDEALVAAARNAALQARFDRKPDAPVQAGTITYIFRLQD